MKKVLIFVILIILSLLINGCKPTFENQLRDCLIYYEKSKLQGENENFFIKLVFGEREGKSFCNIALIPKIINLENFQYTYIYVQNIEK